MAVEWRPLRLLASEGLRDAARRRVVPAVAGLCFLTLAMVNSCTQCSPAVETTGGQLETLAVFGWAGVITVGLLALWCSILAGLVASDHLSATLEDGSALLVLSRPLSRRTFALARLGGSLTISFAAAFFLLGGTGILLAIRGELPLLPAVLAIGATMVNCIGVAALAMVSSLYLPRMVTFLLVIGGVASVAMANLMAASGMALGTVLSLLDEIGPPILSAIVLALSGWSGQPLEGDAVLNVAVRMGVWAVGSVSTLLFLFEHRELTHYEPR
ncbi:MAG TPA: ABC transporter permease [Myxococcales bacterium]|nr:ABC transporter permease [Myxococcales bacterium]